MRWTCGLWLLSGLVAGLGALASGPPELFTALGPGVIGGLARWRGWPCLVAGALAWTLGLAAWSAVQGWWWTALLGVGLGLVAWDLSSAAFTAPGMGGRLLWLQARRSLALAGGGMGMAACWRAFSWQLPFHWLLALVGLVWLAVLGLIWLAGRAHPSGGAASGNRSSSGPME